VRLVDKIRFFLRIPEGPSRESESLRFGFSRHSIAGICADWCGFVANPSFFQPFSMNVAQ
jgi:hypothetical protein